MLVQVNDFKSLKSIEVREVNVESPYTPHQAESSSKKLVMQNKKGQFLRTKDQSHLKQEIYSYPNARSASV